MSHNPNRINLRETQIVSVGGAGGLGSAFSTAASLAGATVYVFDKDKAETDLPSARVDVTDLVGLREQFRRVIEPDAQSVVVVNFAGIHHPSMDLTMELTGDDLETFRRVCEVNLTGAFAVTGAVAPLLVARGGGHILHLCSNGSRQSLFGSYAYNASKHGLEGLVKTAAAQLAPYGVRVNGIAPGTVITNLNRRLLTEDDGEYTARALSILAHTPTKRFATAEGVVESLLAMCVPQRHLTGNVIFADDGYAVEGHSWPEGNKALYESRDELEALLADTGRRRSANQS